MSDPLAKLAADFDVYGFLEQTRQAYRTDADLPLINAYLDRPIGTPVPEDFDEAQRAALNRVAVVAQRGWSPRYELNRLAREEAKATPSRRSRRSKG